MHRAMLIREPAAQISANSLGFCTYTPSHWCNSLTLAVSADAKPPRICTFHSHLNFNPFNTYVLAPSNSSSFCTYKDRGGACPPERSHRVGGVPMLKNRRVEFPPA